MLPSLVKPFKITEDLEPAPFMPPHTESQIETKQISENYQKIAQKILSESNFAEGPNGVPLVHPQTALFLGALDLDNRLYIDSMKQRKQG